MSKKVKRYAADECSRRLGLFVRASDYDAMRSQIESIKEILVGIKKSLEHELEMAGIDDETYCCVDTDDMYGYIQVIEKALQGDQP